MLCPAYFFRFSDVPNTPIDLAEKLYQKDIYSPDLNTPIILAMLNRTGKIGDILQSLNGISAQDCGSRGINAGLSLIIERLSSIKTCTTKSWCGYFVAAAAISLVAGAVYVTDKCMREYY